MSWIQENKFAASVIGATVVLSGALFYLGMDARSSADEARIKGDAAIMTANSLRNKKPYPNKDNLDLVKAKVATFIEDSEAFQKELIAYRPKSLPKPSPRDFNNSVSSHIRSLSAYYKENGIALPTKGRAAFGLELYSGAGMVESNAARYLDYQRKALFYLFKSLADAKPVSLDNVYRTPLPEEAKNYQELKGSGRKSSKVTSVYRSMPIEVRFTGTEKSLKTFLESLANSKEYFFITRSVHVKNVKDESPNLADGLFEKDNNQSGGDFEEFEGIELEGGDQGADSSFANNDPILKQVLGDEKITVHLKIDLILFDEAKNVTFPAAARSASKNN